MNIGIGRESVTDIASPEFLKRSLFRDEKQKANRNLVGFYLDCRANDNRAGRRNDIRAILRRNCRPKLRFIPNAE